MADAPFIVVEALYPGLTQLDFTGPHTIFSRIPGAEVIVASEAGGPIESDDRLTFAGTKRMADIARCDLLFIPGGLASTDVINDLAFMAEFKRLAAGAHYLTSVCTGSLVLGAAGLLKGKRAACHWAWRDMLPLFGAIPDARRVVRDGNVITGGGVTAGIDFALGACLLNPGAMGFEPPTPVGEPDAADAHIRFDVKAEAFPPSLVARFRGGEAHPVASAARGGVRP